MRRRDLINLIALSAVSLPFDAQAQQHNKPRQIGWIAGAGQLPVYQDFLDGMRDLGYVEGRDFVIERRFAEGHYERHPEFAADLVRRNVDVIIIDTTSAIPAVRQATSTIPVIMAYSIDPVGNGIVASLARPGGNITGMASALDDIVSKHFELMVELIPNLSRVGLLTNPASPNHHPFVSSAKAAAQNAKVTLVALEARNQQEIESSYSTAVTERVGAIAILADALFNTYRQRVAELAIANRLPSFFSQREYVLAGGLMSYGNSLADVFRRLAYYVDKIFTGTKPAELPIEQPSKFFLTVNLKTAKAIGLRIPEAFLSMRTDEIIE
jgi:putative tryptophan/tyrosine transport system substrate-binding protein